MIVYTTVFGQTDGLHCPSVRGQCPYVCFTDQDINSDFWEIVKTEKQSNPVLANRIYKASPPFDSDSWLYQDANFTLKVDPEVISANHREDIVNFRHRDRTRISEEAKEIKRLKKARPESIDMQLRDYQANGFDTDENPMQELSCNGIVFRRNTKKVREFNALLKYHVIVYSQRDQMAFDYCAWKLGIKIGRFPGTFDRNPYSKYTHYR